VRKGILRRTYREVDRTSRHLGSTALYKALHFETQINNEEIKRRIYIERDACMSVSSRCRTVAFIPSFVSLLLFK